jgi:hypothetical protein
MLLTPPPLPSKSRAEELAMRGCVRSVAAVAKGRLKTRLADEIA